MQGNKVGKSPFGLLSNCKTKTQKAILGSDLKFFTGSSTRSFIYSDDVYSKQYSDYTTSSIENCLPCLTISTDQLSSLDYNQYNSCGNSPPPPALSPANSSPAIGNNTNLSQISPSPPIIVAEIKDPLSISSNSEKSLKTTRPSKFDNNSVKALSSNVNKICPNLTANSSASSSSNSSTNSLSDAANCTVDNLPILEKMTIALSSPQKDCIDKNGNISFSPPLISKDVANDASQLNTHESTVETNNKSDVHLSPKETTYNNDNSFVTQKSVPSKSGKRKVQNARKKSRSKVSKTMLDSDSDFEPMFNSKNVGTSRGRSDAKALIQRVRKNAVKKSSNGNNAAESVSLNSDNLMHRRYLESPFLCLCQSGCTASALLQNSTEMYGRNKNKCDLSNQSMCFTPTSLQNESQINLNSSSINVHIINPALKDSSSSLTGEDGLSKSTIPGNCPFRSTVQHNGNMNDSSTGRLTNPDGSHEVRAIFADVNYRPSGVIRSRDYQLPNSIDPNSLWICAFCGEDNNYLNLGSLYGPYWITDVELKSFKPDLIFDHTVDHNKLGHTENKASVMCVSKTSSSAISQQRQQPRGGGPGKLLSRSKVTGLGSSTHGSACNVTGSGAASSIRLVIKSASSNIEKDSHDRPRIGSNCEVWFHMECVLWAPGTYIKGNGLIGGLGEALQLTLDVLCSHCKKRGAILSCCNRGCNLTYHYQCALSSGCYLDREQYTLLCKKHHIYS